MLILWTCYEEPHGEENHQESAWFTEEIRLQKSQRNYWSFPTENTKMNKHGKK